ncbi:MAG: FtsW/RodA/SpoVE family cell cycle protein [Oscillospiraceae bacterium]|nr:FtsW/RodA/SpoVE family cell cycle protein [Oscillospiraceae bacterium]
MSRLNDILREFFRKGDVLLLCLCTGASLYGIALIFSATRWTQNYRSVIVQFVAMLVGICLYIALTFVDFQTLVEKGWKGFFAFNVLFLLLLLTPLGTDNNSGNLNWLAIDKIIPGFPLDLQPNEIVKIPFILLMAHQINRIQERGRSISKPSSMLQITAHAMFMVGLIAVICGDMGMCMVYIFLFVILAWTAGVKLYWFLIGAAGAAGGFFLAWKTVLQSKRFEYIRMRFLVVLDHDLDPLDRGFQQDRSLLALGSGGFSGQGFLNGTQTQAPYSSALPARHTDFIFSACGEELGMLGCLLILILLAAIILRCFYVGRTSASAFCGYTATAFGGMLLIQTVFNVGMCLYVLPVMGLTLPFFSYGGSSLITLYVAMGVVSGLKANSLPSWLRSRNRL